MDGNLTVFRDLTYLLRLSWLLENHVSLTYQRNQSGKYDIPIFINMSEAKSAPELKKREN